MGKESIQIDYQAPPDASVKLRLRADRDTLTGFMGYGWQIDTILDRAMLTRVHCLADR